MWFLLNSVSAIMFFIPPQQFRPFICPMQPTWATSLSFLSLQILLLLHSLSLSFCLSLSLFLFLSFLCIYIWYHTIYLLTTHASCHKMGGGEMSQVFKKNLEAGRRRNNGFLHQVLSKILEQISNVWFMST